MYGGESDDEQVYGGESDDDQVYGGESDDEQVYGGEFESKSQHFQIPRFFQYLPKNFDDEEDAVITERSKLQNFATSSRRRQILENQRISYRGFLPSSSKKTHPSYFFTTAGVLACIKPCGIIVGMVEMLRAESATLWVFLIGWLFEQVPKQFWPKGIIGDTVCGVFPRMAGIIEEGDAPEIWKEIFEGIKYWMLDTFHSGHSCRLCFTFFSRSQCYEHFVEQQLVREDQIQNIIIQLIISKSALRFLKPIRKFVNKLSLAFDVGRFH